MSPTRTFATWAVAMVLAATAATASVSSSPAASAPRQGELFVVLAVPGVTYAVEVDGEEKGEAGVGEVFGPFALPSGEHTVRFVPGQGQPLTATVTVRPDRSSDLVLHLPAEDGGDPVADIYQVSTTALAPDTARVLVAHTATVPPADVRVDGKTVFENIANGEFAVADVPAGPHSAELVPAGTTQDPILGPLDVDLPAGTVTMVYAVGSPQNGSMNVITHQEQARTASTVRPRVIATGTAGLVRWHPVTFGAG
ncbi:DUF4397 domain-containing protein [Nocardioides sp. SR21]|uniref:DUF4397 domain-containing protein n=1 Tax=Nocardioides sp. SR21 TaxID=2919501 RepID=UPI001FA98B65|nr:DUF4397 domain-containing protein [Nocardioides sp. SR21]